MEQFVKIIDFCDSREFKERNTFVTIANNLQYLCLVSNLKNAHLFSISSCVKPVLIWTSPSCVDRCIFSDDGEQLLVVLESSSLQIHALKNYGPKLPSGSNVIQLASMLGKFGIELTSTSKVVPLNFSELHIVISISNKWFVSLKWLNLNQLYVVYTIETPSCVTPVTSRGCVYFLTAGGNISAYSLRDGKQLGVINLHTSLPTNGILDTPRTFQRFAVSEDGILIAVSDQANKVYIVNTEPYFLSSDNQDLSSRWNCDDSDTLSVCSSTRTTASVRSHLLGSVPTTKGKTSYKSTWNAYLGSLRRPKPRASKRPHVVCLVDPPTHLDVQCLSMTAAGLAVWFNQPGVRFGGVYRLHDTTTGACLAEQQVAEEMVVVEGGLAAQMDAFVSSDGISLFLGALFRDVLVKKLVHCMETKSLGQLLKTDEWGDVVVPLPLLTTSLKQREVDVARLALSLHTHAFKIALLTNPAEDDLPHWQNRIDNVVSHMDKLFDAIHVAIQENGDKVALSEQLLSSALDHANDLLQFLEESRHGIEAVKKQVLRQVVKLRVHLKKQREETVEEAEEAIGDHRNELSKWKSMEDCHVIRLAISQNNVPMVHTYLSNSHGWNRRKVEETIQTEFDIWLHQLLTNRDFDTSKQMLTNMGHDDPLETLKIRCFQMLNKDLRDSLAEYLTNQNIMNEQEIKTWEFIKVIEEILGEPDETSGNLVINNIINVTSESRSMIIIELYFKTLNVKLKDMIEPRMAWKFLLEYSRKEFLIGWIDTYYNSHQECAQVSQLTEVFDSWEITQNMVDFVKISESLDEIKDSVLDCLSTRGVFCTDEKQHPGPILQRLIRTESLLKLGQVLNQASSNVSVQEFRDMLTTFCIKHKLYGMAFSCLADFEFSEDNLAMWCTGSDNRLHWFKLWLTFRDLFKDPLNERLAVKAVSNHVNYLSEDRDAFLDQHPLLVIALVIYGQGTINNVLENKVPSSFPVNQALLQRALTQLPLLQMALSQDNFRLNPDVTVYQLLRDCSPFDVSKLFKWQENRDKGEIPHFSCGKLVSKYGHKDTLNYIYYLKQGRPSFAASMCLVEQFKSNRNLSRKTLKRVCNIAHGTALENFHNTSISSACIAFIEMLGRDSEALRVHIACGNTILSFRNSQMSDSTRTSINVEQVGSLMLGLVLNKKQTSPEIMMLLETALQHSMQSVQPDVDTVSMINHWTLAVKFARIHSLKLPETFLRFCAKRDMWLPFVLYIELHKYTVDQVLQVVKSFTSLELQDHLSHALGNVPISLNQEHAKDKSRTKLHLRDSRKVLYSRIGLHKEETSSDNQNIASDNLGGTRASSSSSEDTYSLIVSSSGRDAPRYDACEDVLLTLLKCHRSPDPPRVLLNACKTLNNPLLAVLATCYEPSSILVCFCTYLLTSLGGAASTQLTDQLSLAVQQHAWSSLQVEALLVETVATGYVGALARGFMLFLPESPLCAFSDFLMQCITKKSFKESVMNIKLFKASCLNLKNNPSVLETSDFEETFLVNGHWISSVAVHLVGVAVSECFSSSYHQLMFLRTLCEASFSDHLPVATPDYGSLAKIVECLSGAGIHANLSLLSLGPVEQYQAELMHCVDQLLDSQQFQRARSFASLTGLGIQHIVVSEWSYNFSIVCQSMFNGHVGNQVVDFWDKCEDDFNCAKLDPNVAAKFYYNHSEKVQSLKERCHMLQLALSWLRKVSKQESKAILSEDKVELEMWKCWLQIDEIVPMYTKTLSKPQLMCSLKSEVLKAAQELAVENHATLSGDQQKVKLDMVIENLLDYGDISSACRIEAMFSHKNQDLQIILTCLCLAEGEIKPYQLPTELRMLLSEPRSGSNMSYRRRTLQTVRPLSTSSSKYEVSLSCSIGSDILAVGSEVQCREREDTLSVLETLAERLRHGTTVASRVVMCYRVAINLDRPYQYIIIHQQPLTLLKLAISSDCLNKFLVASDLMSAAQTTPEDVAELMCSEIVIAIAKKQNVLWGCDLNASFHLVLELCTDPSLLGSKLLAIATKMADESEGLMEVVELLIRGHDCYTAACNMEGIAATLHFARAITERLLQKQQWAIMVQYIKWLHSNFGDAGGIGSEVRLLTGVGRYTEMSYIFQMLKENEQFEYLLGKGMDKVSGLKLAVLEFLKQRCPENRDLFRMVALHFALYAEVANLWEKEGRSSIHSLLSVASLDSQPVVLCNTEDTRMCLHSTMLSFTHAAEHYLLADKLTRASAAAHQAELLALQISLVASAPTGQGALSLLQLTSQQVTHVITNKISFPQAWIVARAYSHPVDWGAALYQHCVVQGDSSYLTDFTETVTLTPALVEDVVRRFQQEPNPTGEMAKQMKKMLSCVNCVEVTYRIASQLGFRDIIDNLLSGPELPYLKDTVWRSGYSRQNY